MKNLITKTLCIATAILSFLFSSCILVTSDTDILGSTKYSYSNADKYSVGGAVIQTKIETVSVDWIAGSVKVVSSATDCIEFSEKAYGSYNPDYTMRYWVDGTTLRIKFAASKTLNFSNKQKDLVITLPEDYDLSTLDINTVSSSVDVTDVNTVKSKFHTVSGKCKLNFLSAHNELDIDSVSGSINLLNTNTGAVNIVTVSGSVNLLETNTGTVNIETVSGSINLDNATGTSFYLETVSGSINTKGIWSETNIISNTVSGSSNIKFLNATSVTFDSVSGSQTVYLPETVSGFTASAGSLKKLNCPDFSVKIDSNKYIYGDGLLILKFTTVSGKMNIKKF